VYIPKADGKNYPLGILTLKDRVVQMEVVLILEQIFEADFHDCSHGFRPRGTAHDALDAIRANLKAGRLQVYDADLKDYFDTIPHDKLMACMRMRVTDRSVLDLIRRWCVSLSSKKMRTAIVSPRRKVRKVRHRRGRFPLAGKHLPELVR
jgi:RNA-directed DNA polymerase